MGAANSNQPECIKTFNLSTYPNTSRSILYGLTDKMILQLVVPVVSTIGVIGNAVFLFMLIRVPKMRSSLSGYLAALAICDILFLVISNILYIITFNKTDITLAWPAESSTGCVASIVSAHVWYFASVGILTLISIERYFAICQPIRHRHFQGKKRNIKLILFVFIMSVSVTISTIPRYIYYHTYYLIWPETTEFQYLANTVGICGTWSRYYNSYEGFLLVTVFIASAIVNCFLYTKILIALTNRDVSESSDLFKLEAKRVRNQVACTLIINGIAFFICQIPYRIDNLDDTFDYLRVNFNLLDHGQEATVTTIGQSFLFLNSVINPFIYVFCSTHYRQGIKEALGYKLKPVAARQRQYGVN